MQKFGLDSLQNQRLSALEFEIIQEQASALGQAGKKLKLSIQAYQRAKDKLFPANNKNALLQEVANCTYNLILQREFIGFIEGNLEWVREYYKIPNEVISMLGKTPGNQASFTSS